MIHSSVKEMNRLFLYHGSCHRRVWRESGVTGFSSDCSQVFSVFHCVVEKNSIEKWLEKLLRPLLARALIYLRVYTTDLCETHEKMEALAGHCVWIANFIPVSCL